MDAIRAQERQEEEHEALSRSSPVSSSGDSSLGALFTVIDVNEGETLLLPSGWIHAVQTPPGFDTVAVAGNFLHLLGANEQMLAVIASFWRCRRRRIRS